ncbi:hypothetical protein B5P46_08115 [Rhizobium leguminosarum]|uniref:Uncharacterized protein n=1 Tax=Rhizobium leguminosarum TaxID=384 RepID=A0A4Q1UA06_RHILE|nr:hypothetical protein B5P46_08115 [Rhizobium leguminosarum]
MCKRAFLSESNICQTKPGGNRPPAFVELAHSSASSSALCRGSATYQPAVDARDKPEHDERGVAACLHVLDKPSVTSVRAPGTLRNRTGRRRRGYRRRCGCRGSCNRSWW